MRRGPQAPADAHPELTAVVTTTISRSVDSFYGQTIDELRARGCHVHVVTSAGPEIPRLRTRADSVHVIEMSRGIDLVADARALMQWVRLLRRLRPDVVLGGTPKAGLLSMVASSFVRVPRRAYLLQGLRLEGAEGGQRRVLALMEWVTSRSAQRVVAVSPSLALEYQRLGLNAGRPIAVPNHGSSHGVDSDHFRPAPRDPEIMRALDLDPSRPTAIFIGRLTADKGPVMLLSAAQAVVDSGVPVQLLVLGAQDEADSARHLAELMASQIAVRVLDHLDDVRPYLALSDVLLLPTRREGLPNVVLEAAAMGIPSITTTSTGAVDSVVEGVTGFLVDFGDSTAMADRLRRILVDQELAKQLGEAARARVVRDFQPHDVARSIVNLAMADPDGSALPASHPEPGVEPPLEEATASSPGVPDVDGSGTVVYVTGATGFIGSGLVPELRQAGFVVHTLGRGGGVDLRYDAIERDGFAPGAVIVHLAGKAHDLSREVDPGEYHRANVDLTSRLWDSACRSGARRFVFMSSVKALADNPRGVLTEDTDPSPRTPYGVSKLDAERILETRSAGGAGAPELIVLRPCMVHGPGVKGNMRLLIALVRRGFPYPLGAFDNARSTLSLDNLVHVILRACAGTLPPGSYNIADDEALSTVDMVQTIAEALGTKPRVLRVPPRLVRLGARIGTAARLPFDDDALGKLTETFVVDNARLRRALGLETLPTSTREGIRRAVTDARPMR